MATAIWAKGTDTGRGGSNAPAPAPAYVTYEQFLEQTAGGDFAEWEDGIIRRRDELVSTTHTRIGVFLITILRVFCEDTGAGEVFYAPYNMRLRQVNRGREPDIAVVLAANASRITPKFLDGAADLAIEIVSPESVERDNEIKFAEYETCGVSEYWILDPEAKTARFYAIDTATGKYAEKLPDANGVVESAVLAGFWLSVAWLWQEPLPTVRTVLATWDTGKK